MNKMYPTPKAFVDALVIDGTPAHQDMQEMVATFKPTLQPFVNGKALWNEKHRVDVTLFEFRKDHESAPTWTKFAQDDALTLMTRMAGYFARFEKSPPEVQQASRTVPEDIQRKMEVIIKQREKSGPAGKSTQPSKGGFGLLALLAFGAFMFLRKAGK